MTFYVYGIVLYTILHITIYLHNSTLLPTLFTLQGIKSKVGQAETTDLFDLQQSSQTMST